MSLSIIEVTWSLFEDRLKREGVTAAVLMGARAGFCSALYATSAAVLCHEAYPEEFSKLAERIERETR